jgi:hypothetical protein
MASINATTSSGIVTTADNTGQLQLQSAGTTIATVSSTGLAVTGTIASSTGVTYPIVSGTAVASTSGTSIDFTGIPSWVKRITVMFNGVSTNGSSVMQVQLGDSGGVETSGYSAVTTYISLSNNTTRGLSSSSGFPFSYVNSAATVYSGVLTISLQGSNVWVSSGHIHEITAGLHNIGGNKTLSDTLTQIRITTVNGTDTFDAGSINIMYE